MNTSMNEAQFNKATDSCGTPTRQASLKQQAFEIARKATREAARFDRLAERLSPEIEMAIECFRECMELGLIRMGR